jgi:hypothetical protein
MMLTRATTISAAMRIITNTKLVNQSYSPV